MGDVLFAEVREDDAAARSIGEINRAEGKVFAAKRESGVSGFESAPGRDAIGGDQGMVQGIDTEKLSLHAGRKSGGIDTDSDVGEARD